MANFSIKPLMHMNREVVEKWDSNGSLVVFFCAVTGSIAPIFHDGYLPENSLICTNTVSQF